MSETTDDTLGDPIHATVHEVTELPAPPDESWADGVIAALRAAGSPVGLLVGRTMTHGTGIVVALWRTKHEAALVAASAGAPLLGNGAGFEVTRRHRGVDPGPARYLQMTCFDGPRTTAWVRAVQRADDERIAPVIRDVPGAVGGLTLQAPDGGRVILGLATSVEAFEDVVGRIMSTALLPGEDPADLTGPDRVELHRLLRVDLATDVLS